MNKFNIATLVVAVFFLFSCSDDYLETTPTEFTNVSALNQIAEYDPSVYDGVLAGVYVNMSSPGTGGTERADDLGQKGYDIMSDMMSSDMVLAGLNYGWYRGVSNYTWVEDASSSINYMPWRYYYRIIRGANAVIDANGGNDYVPANDADAHIIGQAKALRGYAYFYLAQFFQTEYNPSEELLPIYTEAILTNEPLSPMSEVYDLIVSDLSTAIDYLDNYNRDYPFQINRDVAAGLLAYTYGAMQQYDKVLPLAESIVNSGRYPLMGADEVTGGFNEVLPGWMWGIDITADMELSLASFWGVMDKYSYSYAWAGDMKTIDSSLYNKLSDDDVRKNQFVNYEPINKFYNFDKKIGGSSLDNNEMDYVYMRVAEFYLLAAEAAYKVGNEGLAKTYLKQLMDQRVEDSSYIDSLSGSSLMEEISNQTRLELWGEGKSYLLMKRNKETRTRGGNHILFPNETFAYNEDRLSFTMPLSERQNNPFID